MNNAILPFMLFLSFFCYGCAETLNDNKTNASKYLDEVKACYSDENPAAGKDLMLPEDLRTKLSMIEIEDYIGERVFKSGDLIIQFRKKIGDDVFFIDIEISQMRSGGCELISIYEVLQ